MEITLRDLVTVLHGMGFGTLFMLAFSGVIYATAVTDARWQLGASDRLMFRFYLISMAVLSWLSGVYVVYPWYRASPPAGSTNLADHPQRLLLSNPLAAGWHSYGMEWKEHVAWLTPIAMTMVTYVFIAYGPRLARFRQLRNAVPGFTAVAFLATAVAGMCGAFLNKYAPVRGGPEIVLMQQG